MEEPEIIPPKQPNPVKSWANAYMQFLKDPKENRALKLMPLVLLGIVLVAVADDFLLPIIGFADNVPTAIVAIIVAVFTYLRVRRYR